MPYCQLCDVLKILKYSKRDENYNLGEIPKHMLTYFSEKIWFTLPTLRKMQFPCIQMGYLFSKVIMGDPDVVSVFHFGNYAMYTRIHLL